MKRIVFDIETEPFTEDFLIAKELSDKRQHAPKMRLACIYNTSSRRYSYYVEETVGKLISQLQGAEEVISFNGKNFDVLVLQRHYNLKGSVPRKGKHIDLLEVMHKQAGFRVSLNVASQINLGEKKHTNGRNMNLLGLDELKVACRSDVNQTYRLWKLYVAGRLEIPKKRFYTNNAYELGPGEHMPNSCPYCGAGREDLEFIEWETDEMTDGQMADYDAGLYGTVLCNSCLKEFDYGF